MRNNDIYLPLSCCVWFTIVVVLSSNLPFFGDNVLLASRYAGHFYQNGWGNFLLPAEIDAGHPPFYAVYLTLYYKVLGASLLVSHLAVLPLIWGIVWAYWGIANRVLSGFWLYSAMLLLLVEPCLMAQTALGSADLALLCFFLWAVYGLVRGNWVITALAMPFLCLLSLRGMILCAGIGLGHWLLFDNKQQKVVTIIPYYLPALLVSIGWLLYHYQLTGFLAYNPTHTHWAEHYKPASFDMIQKNLLVIGWRVIDQGRGALWLVVGGLLLKQLPYMELLQNSQNINKIDWQNQANAIIGLFTPLQKQIIFFAVLHLLCLLPFLVFRQMPILHRYFMPFNVLWLLVSVIMVSRLVPLNWGKKLVLGASVVLLSGHAWIYPYPIANGWDATLACLPYFGAKDAANAYITAQNIEPQKVCTAFPMVTGKAFTHLEPQNNCQFSSFPDPTLILCQYVLYSNISNDFTPQQRLLLQDYFIPEATFNRLWIDMVLYKNKISY